VSPRGRLVVAGVVAVAVVVGGVAMERRLGAAPPAPTDVEPGVSGAWYCPHGGGSGWRAWVVVANPTDTPADLVLTSRSGTGPPQASTSIVAPESHAYVEVPAPEMASATVVEFFGSTVAAGMVTARPDGEGGVAAEPCADRPATRWFVSEASTLRGQEANVVVHNPFASEAVVDVGLLTGKGPIRHGRLKGLVLDPGQVKAVPVGEFALGEPGVAAEVTAHLGRVVAAGINVSTAGVRSVVGTPAPAARWVLPGAGDPAAGRMVVAAPSGQAAFRADALGQSGQTPLVDLESVPGGSAAAFDLPAEGGGVLVEGEGRQPLLAGRLVVPPAPAPAPERRPKPRKDQERKGGGRGGGGKGQERAKPEEPPPPEPADLASTGGAPAGAARWLVLPATAPEGGPAALLLQNPGGGTATVTVTLLGTGGPEGSPETVEVPPSATVRVDLPGTPVAAVVESAGGVVVPAQASLDRRTYAVAVGVPLA